MTGVIAQAPEKMSYQAVIRDTDNELVINQSVGMRISILQGSADDTAVYIETQNHATNANGLVSIEIGGGTIVSGDFSTVDWSTGPWFIKTETDPAGGTDYTITGTIQLLSVPYALYAKKAESLVNINNLFRVSFMGDTLFTCPGNWVIIPGISQANSRFIDARDGNIYPTVTIGEQVWMAENLKYLPSDTEWTELENYLADNGYNYDGTTGGGGNKIAKSMASASGWSSSSDTGAVGNTDYPAYINKSGFTALPGGYQRWDGAFHEIGVDVDWWSSTQFEPVMCGTGCSYAWIRYLRYNTSSMHRNNDPKESGFSVRCLRDYCAP